MSRPLTPAATALLVLLRTAIGWHFLYEGAAKLLEPGWTAAPYLQAASGPAGGLFRALAGSAAMPVVDAANAWGLAAIGLALMLGLFPRLAAGAGASLLLLYYAAHPPLAGHEPGNGMDGSDGAGVGQGSRGACEVDDRELADAGAVDEVLVGVPE